MCTLRDRRAIPTYLLHQYDAEVGAVYSKLSRGCNLGPPCCTRIQAALDEVAPCDIPSEEEIQDRAISRKIVTICWYDEGVILVNTEQ
jgi:hypothetical protein